MSILKLTVDQPYKHIHEYLALCHFKCENTFSASKILGLPLHHKSVW
uniref:Uncharacterized protein n=1 Tax=Anguilla anguilla TaxID=7936 RepID=A0A0E9XA65_ANGAN